MLPMSFPIPSVVMKWITPNPVPNPCNDCASETLLLMFIGVLTGRTTAKRLMASGADVIVPYVGYIPALLQAMKR